MSIERTIILGIVGTLSLLPVVAAAAGWINTVHAVSMRSSTSFISFATTEPMQNPAGCGRSDFCVVNSSVDYKSDLAILLNAYALGTTVSIHFGPSCDPSIGAPVVTDVMMN